MIVHQCHGLDLEDAPGRPLLNNAYIAQILQRPRSNHDPCSLRARPTCREAKHIHMGAKASSRLGNEGANADVSEGDLGSKVGLKPDVAGCEWIGGIPRHAAILVLKLKRWQGRVWHGNRDPHRALEAE